MLHIYDTTDEFYTIILSNFIYLCNVATSESSGYFFLELVILGRPRPSVTVMAGGYSLGPNLEQPKISLL